MFSTCTILLAFCTVFQIVSSTELTFELPDNGKECFFEEIKANTSATIEFQVCITHKVLHNSYINK